MPTEMAILRNELNQKGVEWLDESDDFDRSFPFFDMTIYKTRYKYNGHDYVVVSGFGTLGGEHGLLELRIDNNEPQGSLKADYILQLMG